MSQPLSASSTARLMAIQLIYSFDIREEMSSLTPEMFTQEASHTLLFHEQATSYNSELYEALCLALIQQWDALDAYYVPYLAPGWSNERLGYVLRAVLRVAVAESLAVAHTPRQVLVKEYTDLTAILAEPEHVTFVNGLLDRMTRVLAQNGSCSLAVEPVPSNRQEDGYST